MPPEQCSDTTSSSDEKGNKIPMTSSSCETSTDAVTISRSNRSQVRPSKFPGFAQRNLLEKIETNQARIGVIGLGYVGLPLAISFSEKMMVVGYDSDHRRVELLRRGSSYVEDVESTVLSSRLKSRLKIANAETELSECDCIMVCVPTPLDNQGAPDLSFIKSAAETLRSVIRAGMLLVLESTSYPGTTEEFLGTAIREAGFSVGDDVHLAFSPERIDPMNQSYNISNTAKIVGGVDDVSTEIAAKLYSKIITANIVKVRDCKTAEAAKMLENVFRFVNVGLINELSLIFDRMGIDTWEVIQAASTKPFGFMPHYPGPGIGGHCIPKDPIYMSYGANRVGLSPKFIEHGKNMNDFMKHHTVKLALCAIEDSGTDPSNAVVGLMGLAYKPGISDTRDSPSMQILSELSKSVKFIHVHDPFAKSIRIGGETYHSEPIEFVLNQCDCLVFVTDHDQYRNLDPALLKVCGVRSIVDARNVFEKGIVERNGIVYRAIGKPSCVEPDDSN